MPTVLQCFEDERVLIMECAISGDRVTHCVCVCVERLHA